MNQVLPIKIIGVGRYLPDRIVDNAEVEKMTGMEPGSIDKSSAGVRQRRWVDGESGTWMGAQAAQEALDDAGLTIHDIDLIINGSGTQEQAIPDGGPIFQRHLGIEESGIPAISVHCTCLSFLVSLNIAANFLASGQHRNILIYSADIASRAINPKESESFVLFGDAAAAAVVTRTPAGEASNMEKFIFRTFGAGAYHTCVMGGGTSRHPNMETTTPEDNLFHMEGYKVFRLAHKHGPETLEMLRPGLTKGLGDIDLVIPHQASGMAIKSLMWFGWPEEKIAMTIETLGNCIAASIPVTLYDSVKTGRLQRGSKFLLVGTGAGVSIGGAILTY